MATTFINLTPHDIVVMPGDGDPIRLPASGTVARVQTTPGGFLRTVDGVPLFSAPQMGELVGLPEQPEDGTYYIVSSLVASAAVAANHPLVAAGRMVYPDTSPAGAVRDESGRIVGVRRLIVAGAGQ